MKLAIKLNGTDCECAIGYSLLTAAFENLKKERHAMFRATIEAIASAGSGLDSKESVLVVLEEHIRNQVPTDGEVKQWLLTLEGQKFALIHGTRNYPTKLNSQTAELVLDEMSETDADSLVDNIGSLCFGAELAAINRESASQYLAMSRVNLDKLKLEIAEAAKKEEPQKTESEVA